jgi:hypothetical protein
LAHGAAVPAGDGVERAGDMPEVLIVEMQIRHHDGKERHDHEPIDAGQSEA